MLLNSARQCCLLRPDLCLQGRLADVSVAVTDCHQTKLFSLTKSEGLKVNGEEITSTQGDTVLFGAGSRAHVKPLLVPHLPLSE